MKHREGSESFRRCQELQEASQNIRTAQHKNINKNKKQNTVTLNPKVDYKISTVKKYCQLITLLIMGC